MFPTEVRVDNATLQVSVRQVKEVVVLICLVIVAILCVSWWYNNTWREPLLVMVTGLLAAFLVIVTGLRALLLWDRISLSLYMKRSGTRALNERHSQPVPPIGWVMSKEEGMTVGVLIEQLQKEPLNAPVFVMRRLAPLEVPAVIPIDAVVPAVVRPTFGGPYTYLADGARDRYEGQQNAVILAFEQTLPPSLQPFENQE